MRFVVAVLLAAACGNEPQTTVFDFEVATWNTFLRPPDLEGGVLPPSDPACRAERAGEFLQKAEPRLDFVGLQEMLDPDLQKELVAAAPALSFVNGPRPQECERDGPCGIQPGGLTALARPTIGVGTTQAKGYSDCQGTDCLANKGIFYLPVSFGDSVETDVHLLFTHLQAAGGAVPAPEIRASQVEEIRAFLESTVCGESRALRPVIVMGDLNIPYLPQPSAEFNNDEYAAARATLELSCLGAPVDVLDDDPSHEGTFSCFGGLLPVPCMQPEVAVRVDHIWYWPANGSLEVTDFATLDVESPACETEYASDHRLVRASFRVLR